MSSASSTPVCPLPTHVADTPHGPQLIISHPRDAFAIGLRGYISTLLPFLKCRMDVQMTDGKDMLLRYVTSYVAKWHDSFQTAGLYSRSVSACQAAVRHVKDLHPCKPEMWLALSSMKHCWTSSTTEKYMPPTSMTVADDNTAHKYRLRPSSTDSWSFLKWLRHVTHTKDIPTLYRHPDTLVGIKYLSVFKDEFFQYLLMNMPHCHLSDLAPLPNCRVPVHLCFFASAAYNFPNTWGSGPAVIEMLEHAGHRKSYISTVTAYVETLHDVLSMCSNDVLSPDRFNTVPSVSSQQYTLDIKQQSVLHHVHTSLHQ